MTHTQETFFKNLFRFWHFKLKIIKIFVFISRIAIDLLFVMSPSKLGMQFKNYQFQFELSIIIITHFDVIKILLTIRHKLYDKYLN